MSNHVIASTIHDVIAITTPAGEIRAKIIDMNGCPGIKLSFHEAHGNEIQNETSSAVMLYDPSLQNISMDVMAPGGKPAGSYIMSDGPIPIPPEKFDDETKSCLSDHLLSKAEMILLFCGRPLKDIPKILEIARPNTGIQEISISAKARTVTGETPEEFIADAVSVQAFLEAFPEYGSHRICSLDIKPSGRYVITLLKDERTWRV